MAFGQSSFRRILLSRLLLLSVPILLVGVYVTYSKARSAFLDTAEQNLTESAVRKSESVIQSVEALRTNLASASDAEVLKADSPEDHQLFISRLSQVLPTNILCVQLNDLVENRVTATTCGETLNLNHSTWSKTQENLVASPAEVEVNLLLPSQAITGIADLNDQSSQNQLRLWLNAPVYDRNGDLRYALSVKSAILSQEKKEPGSLEGYTVVINQDGVILAHPFSQRVGRNISQMPDARRLTNLLQYAISGESDFIHLFYLEKDGVELLAGYSVFSSPVTLDNQRQWIILAVTPLDAALIPLKDIRWVLIGMTIGLIGANTLAMLYISKELARPLEKIRDFTLKEEHLNAQEHLVENFQIREFSQLASAIDKMVTRLRAWGDEIISAWKEAQTANKLKSEFLATTSHELRTPLNGIINCIRVVKEGYCDSKEEEHEFLSQADDAAIHLLRIINDVLDISKIEAGKLSVNLEQVDLVKIVQDVIELQLVNIRQKKLSLKSPQLAQNIFVWADGAKLKQILINILGNAIKFTDRGSISVEISVNPGLDNLEEKPVFARSPLAKTQDSFRMVDTPLKLMDETKLRELTNSLVSIHHSHNKNFDASKKITNDRVVIKVKDTGIGIAPEQQEKLFRPFVMVDGSTTRKYGGTGLGLAISRNLIELMGGSIDLYSEGENHGTTVVLTLPIAETTS